MQTKIRGNSPITIVGTGPAGMAAALTVAHNGGRAVIYERSRDVGHRSHGDFQGIENWTTDQDVLEELSAMGINPTFDNIPFREAVIYDPEGREFRCQSPQPLFYLVRRGQIEGSLDMALKQQAQDAGVDIRFNSPCPRILSAGIVAQGPHRADVIAVGYVFETQQADGAFVVLSDKLAPQGYAYLLIHAGRGTLASCMFNDFHNEGRYLENTVDFFQKNTGLSMRNEQRFGGGGNFSIPSTARKGELLYVGETAGFQDAFAGFGMRYAIQSGHLAAMALISGRSDEYDRLWKNKFGGLLRTSIVNRFIYATLGEFIYRKIIRAIVNCQDARVILRNQYGPMIWKSFLFPFAHRAFNHRLKGMCVDASCHCTWCRCRCQHGA